MLNIRTLIRPAAALLLAASAACAMAAGQTLAVSIIGPGGHSNGNYGNVNAVHAAARSIMLIEKAVPDAVVSDIQGGNSVNSIAASADFIVTIMGDEASLKARRQGEGRRRRRLQGRKRPSAASRQARSATASPPTSAGP